MPNLTVNGFQETLLKSKAKIIFPINLTNKFGHTLYWKVSNYVNNIEKYLGKLVDIILVNNEMPSTAQIEQYKLKEGDGVLVEDDFMDKRVIRAPLLSHQIVHYDKNDTVQDVRSFIRHDPKKIANSVANIIV